jgi:VWFA-related protein
MNTPARVLATLCALAMAAPLAGQGPPAPSKVEGAQQPPPAQQPDPQQQPPRIRTGINYVRVDVIVTDKSGTPVLDLKPEEFVVSEDGKPQKIEAFDVVKIDEAIQAESRPPKAIRNDYDEEQEAARPDVRLFVILLDDYHVRRGSDLAVRKPLIDFIQNQLAPADMVALMYPLTPVSDLRFTRDRDMLVNAINRFEGRKFIYEPRNSFEEKYAYYPASVVERVRNQVTMDALKGAAVRMGGLREGRKSIILVSEGFTTSLPAQLNDPVAAMPGLGNPNRGNANAAGANDTQRMMAQADMFTDMRDVFDTLNRQNTSIYAVDPRGLAVFEYGINESVGLQQDTAGLRATIDTLHVLANNTDGRAIVNRNDLASGMKQILRDASGYYLIGYSSSEAPTDGKFHEIKVSVKRRGVDVRARKGYWAYTADDAARASAAASRPEAPTAITSALGSLAEPARGRPARFWIGTSRAESGATKVTFAWEPIPAVPGGRAPEPAARVAVTATATDGRPLYKGKVQDDGATVTTPGAVRGGSMSFEAPPGQVRLRLVVEGPRGEIIDSVVRELTLPDFTAVEVTLGTPRLYRARTVREMQAIKANASTMPAVDREFSRSERVLLRVEAYAPGGVTPVVTARLLNRGGTAMADLPVQQPATGTFEIDLPLGAFAAGEYLIELNAKTPGGTAQEIVAFRVGR